MNSLDDAYKYIFQTLNDGVMVVSLTGEILVFNQAAAEILDLPAEEVLGKRLIEVFFNDTADNDEFTQTVFNAVHEKQETLRLSAPYVSPRGKRLFLEITTSYLEDDFKGVVVVFKDVTGYRALYDEEKELTQQLSEAYRKLEQKNESLQNRLKRNKMARRLGVSLLALLVLLAAGFFYLRKGDFFASTPKDVPQQTLKAQTVTVRQQPVSLEVSLTGHFEPLNIVNLVSPFSGRIIKKFVEFGQEVTKGQPLVQLDTSDLQVKLREAESQFIKAQQEYDKLREWENSDEVRSAHRDFVRAKMSLDSAHAKLTSSKDLLLRGIIPQEEYDSLQEQYDNRELDYTSAQEKLVSVKEKGSEENLRIAQMALENARFSFQNAKQKIKSALIKAPVDGLVIKSSAVESDKQRALEVGASFNEGEILLAIGNMEGFTVRTKADEVDMVRLEVGQPVSIKSDALPDMQLSGHIQSISSQASNAAGSREAAFFDVVVRVEQLTPQQREKLRLGMLAVMEVTIYSNPDAVVAPIRAVQRKGGDHFVLVPSEDGLTQRHVTVGKTTLDAVEIIEGLEPGETILADAP